MKRWFVFDNDTADWKNILFSQNIECIAAQRLKYQSTLFSDCMAVKIETLRQLMDDLQPDGIVLPSVVYFLGTSDQLAIYSAISFDDRQVAVVGLPSPSILALLNSKIAMTVIAQSLGIPTVPWNGDDITLDLDVSSLDTHTSINNEMYRMALVTSVNEALSCCGGGVLGFPLVVKSSQMRSNSQHRQLNQLSRNNSDRRTIRNAGDISPVFSAVQASHPHNDLFIMKEMSGCRLIKIDFVTDKHKNILILNTRDCSIQYQNHVLIERSLDPDIMPLVSLQQMVDNTILYVKTINYADGFGTIEFLYHQETLKHYFLKLSVPPPSIIEKYLDFHVLSVQILIASDVALHDIECVRSIFVKLLSGSGEDIDSQFDYLACNTASTLMASIKQQYTIIVHSDVLSISGSVLANLNSNNSMSDNSGGNSDYSNCSSDYSNSSSDIITAHGASRAEAVTSLSVQLTQLLAATNIAFSNNNRTVLQMLVDTAKSEAFLHNSGVHTTWFEQLHRLGQFSSDVMAITSTVGDAHVPTTPVTNTATSSTNHMHLSDRISETTKPTTTSAPQPFTTPITDSFFRSRPNRDISGYSGYSTESDSASVRNDTRYDLGSDHERELQHTLAHLHDNSISISARNYDEYYNAEYYDWSNDVEIDIEEETADEVIENQLENVVLEKSKNNETNDSIIDNDLDSSVAESENESESESESETDDSESGDGESSSDESDEEEESDAVENNLEDVDSVIAIAAVDEEQIESADRLEGGGAIHNNLEEYDLSELVEEEFSLTSNDHHYHSNSSHNNSNNHSKINVKSSLSPVTSIATIATNATDIIPIENQIRYFTGIGDILENVYESQYSLGHETDQLLGKARNNTFSTGSYSVYGKPNKYKKYMAKQHADRNNSYNFSNSISGGNSGNSCGNSGGNGGNSGGVSGSNSHSNSSININKMSGSSSYNNLSHSNSISDFNSDNVSVAGSVVSNITNHTAYNAYSHSYNHISLLGMIEMDLTKMLSKQTKIADRKTWQKPVKTLILKSNKIKYLEVTTSTSNSHSSNSSSHIITANNNYYFKIYYTAEYALPVIVHNITDLNLSFNHFTKLPSRHVLERLTNLTSLNMENNQLTDISSDSILALAGHHKLRHLDLSHNNILQLPLEIGALVTLTKLKLNHNKLIELPYTIVKLVLLATGSSGTDYFDVHGSGSKLNNSNNNAVDQSFTIKNNNLVNPSQEMAQKGGIRWLRVHFLLAQQKSDREKYGNSSVAIDPTELSVYNLVKNQVGESSNRSNVHGSGSKHSKNASHSKNDSGSSSSSNTTKTLQMRIIVVGHDQCGKTSLIQRLQDATKVSHGHSSSGDGNSNNNRGAFELSKSGSTGFNRDRSHSYTSNTSSALSLRREESGAYTTGRLPLLRDMSSTSSASSSTALSVSSHATSTPSLSRGSGNLELINPNLATFSIDEGEGTPYTPYTPYNSSNNDNTRDNTSSSQNRGQPVQHTRDREISGGSSVRTRSSVGDKESVGDNRELPGFSGGEMNGERKSSSGSNNAVEISHWHPKKKALNKFLTEYKSNSSSSDYSNSVGGNSGSYNSGLADLSSLQHTVVPTNTSGKENNSNNSSNSGNTPNRVNKRLLKDIQIFDTKDDIRYIIWDFNNKCNIDHNSSNSGLGSDNISNNSDNNNHLNKTTNKNVRDGIQDIFFSEHSLHIVVFDVTQITSTEHYSVAAAIDHHIQYYIDRIHAQVHNAHILIVATHIDRLASSEVDARLTECAKRLRSNAEKRRLDLVREMEASKDTERKSQLKALLDSSLYSRIDFDIVRVTCCSEHNSSYVNSSISYSNNSESMSFIKVLMCRIVQLSTTTTTAANNNSNSTNNNNSNNNNSKEGSVYPFGIINSPLSQITNVVKHTLDDFRRKQNKQYCTLAEIYDAIFNTTTSQSTTTTPYGGRNRPLEPTTPGGNHLVSEKRRAENAKQIREAVEHWAKVGEVVWFNFSPNSTTSATGSKKKNQNTSTSTSAAGLRSALSSTASLNNLGGTETTNNASNSINSAATALATTEVVFLDPEWLLKILRGVTDRRLYDRVASKDVYSIASDRATIESIRQQRHAQQMTVSKGIVQWTDVKDFLVSSGVMGLKTELYDGAVGSIIGSDSGGTGGANSSEGINKVLSVVRTLCERYKLLIPVQHYNTSSLRSTSTTSIASHSSIPPPPTSSNSSNPNSPSKQIHKSASASNLTRQLAELGNNSGISANTTSSAGVSGNTSQPTAATTIHPTANISATSIPSRMHKNSSFDSITQLLNKTAAIVEASPAPVHSNVTLPSTVHSNKPILSIDTNSSNNSSNLTNSVGVVSAAPIVSTPASQSQYYLVPSLLAAYNSDHQINNINNNNIAANTISAAQQSTPFSGINNNGNNSNNNSINSNNRPANTARNTSRGSGSRVHQIVTSGLSGFVTLERVFYFSRHIPNHLVHSLYATIINHSLSALMKKHSKAAISSTVLSDSHHPILSSSNHVWDSAFTHEHDPIKIFVQLLDCEVERVVPLQQHQQQQATFTSNSNIPLPLGLSSSSSVDFDSLGGKTPGTISTIPTTPHRMSGSGHSVPATPHSTSKATSIPTASAALSTNKVEHNSQLIIRGYGHLFNSQLILQTLDYYCDIVHSLLATMHPGMTFTATVKSVCPDCLLNNESAEHRGEFNYSGELAALQREYDSYCVRENSIISNVSGNNVSNGNGGGNSSGTVSDNNENVDKNSNNISNIGSSSPRNNTSNCSMLRNTLTAHQLRKWNSKRHICSKQRCRVRSDLLVAIPYSIRREIEKVSKAEHEIHFLLDEVVRSSSNNDSGIKKSVVKIMAANALSISMTKLKATVQANNNSSSTNSNSSKFSHINVKPFGFASGVVVQIPPPIATLMQHSRRNKITTITSHNNNSGDNHVYVLTCEHLLTEILPPDKTSTTETYRRKCIIPGFDTVFFVGGPSHWYYLAEIVFQGSHYSECSNWWDLCVLRIIAPIKPTPQANVPDYKIEITSTQEVERLRRELAGEYSANNTATNTENTENTAKITPPVAASVVPVDRSLLLPHPYFSAGNAPLVPVKIARKKVVVDQVVRLLGYPGNGELSIDWGRIVQNNLHGDILIKLLSDNGSSGGPILDRSGDLVGLLSRSHESIKNSCVQPLRNLDEILYEVTECENASEEDEGGNEMGEGVQQSSCGYGNAGDFVVTE